jgi:adenylylsulfate kinase-like enzyme
MDTNTPLLWLCGAPGAGKTATAWAIFEQLRDAGVRAAFVDADQLGMCYPQAEDDPQNDRIKAQAFGAVAGGRSRQPEQRPGQHHQHLR